MDHAFYNYISNNKHDIYYHWEDETIILFEAKDNQNKAILFITYHLDDLNDVFHYGIRANIDCGVNNLSNYYAKHLKLNLPERDSDKILCPVDIIEPFVISLEWFPEKRVYVSCLYCDWKGPLVRARNIEIEPRTYNVDKDPEVDMFAATMTKGLLKMKNEVEELTTTLAALNKKVEEIAEAVLYGPGGAIEFEAKAHFQANAK